MLGIGLFIEQPIFSGIKSMDFLLILLQDLQMIQADNHPDMGELIIISSSCLAFSCI
jgi:hypothetical protein